MLCRNKPLSLVKDIHVAWNIQSECCKLCYLCRNKVVNYVTYVEIKLSDWFILGIWLQHPIRELYFIVTLKFVYDIGYWSTSFESFQTSEAPKEVESNYVKPPRRHYFYRHRRSAEESNLLEMLRTTEHEECYSRLICTMATGNPGVFWLL